MSTSAELPIALWAGWTYYPNGGVGDFKGYYPTVEAAREAVLATDTGGVPTWAQIADREHNPILIGDFDGIEWRWREAEPKDEPSPLDEGF